MDEVENPDLPAAGESSPTLRPIEDDEDSAIDLGSPPKSDEDTSETSEPIEGSNRRSPLSPRRLQLPARPALRREGSAPPQEAPPAPPEPILDSPQDQPDSLTLADLRQLRGLPSAQLPPKQQLLDCDSVYDFQYHDAESFPVELEEWFTYSEEEQGKLRSCQAVFNEEWKSTKAKEADWLDVTEDVRRVFLAKRIETLAQNKDGEEVSKALAVLTYVGLGIWEETAGRQERFELQDLLLGEDGGHNRLQDYASSTLQLRWIVAMVDTLDACDGLKIIYETLRRVSEEDFKKGHPELLRPNEPAPPRPDESIELWCCLTLMYLFIEVARTTSGENGRRLKDDVTALEPNLITFFTQNVAKMRWDESAPIPLTKMLLLSWKAVLVTIGGLRDVENVKAFVREDHHEQDAAGQPIITASPLDYHLFRQEISSKYPAYQPPPPLFPLEPENNSILPPLKRRQPSFTFDDTAYVGAPSVGTDSIMHQPVHIATPAPSPPPSPGGPGKAGKKQNYQTNQMFPFLYPPLEVGSNALGGKGGTQLQDALVGRQWEGSDIPASILEAAELFAKRMRATRAMKQLWEARVDFMKYERGWKPSKESYDEEDDFEIVDKTAPEDTAEQGEPLLQTKETRQLAAVATLYRELLPHLQSVIIVMLKAVLYHITGLAQVLQQNGQPSLQPPIQFHDANEVNGVGRPMENGTGPDADGITSIFQKVDTIRTFEITCKAMSAFLILLLKWLKVSHVLQYEYVTQLLVDSNCVPLTLKIWHLTDVGRACHFKLDREESSFFTFCRENSRQATSQPNGHNHTNAVDDSDDEAQPPPIQMRRSDPENILSPNTSPPDFSHPPEVDDLGYPQTPLPTTPITTYSYRNVHSYINFLRVLQKVTRRKTHRALLLVSYKSSQHLKKSLKTPIRDLRYYTLKLFKSQVPFCGRKWRQGNMKIITAVWLSVPAELRDDWLSGGGGGMGGACVGDVDGTVEDALPLEQSLRSLTHWWNLRNFPEEMGVEKGGLQEEEEVDFFERELERMDFGREVEGENGVEEGDEGGMAWTRAC